MSIAAWPTLALVGGWVTLAGAVVALFAGAAMFAQNDRLAMRLLLVAAPPVVLGGVLVVLGVGGWWVVLAFSVLAAFTWLVRPNRHA